MFRIAEFWATIQNISQRSTSNCKNATMFDEIDLNFEFGAVEKFVCLVDLENAEKENFVAKIVFDTDENGLLEVCQQLARR